LKKAKKVCTRINRYFRNKDARSNFLEENVDTLEYRDCSDKIEVIHLSNFRCLAALLLEENLPSEALVKIQEGLDKIDHKDWDSNLLKVKVLRVLNQYNKAQSVLEDLKEWHSDKKEEIEGIMMQIKDQVNKDKQNEEMMC
jgi:hypothetical protein